ncbi:hypothetical protein RA264_27990, partial [Pseudomonas syringae pv. tagetis]|uniref:hypothetical protein n=1 Tax=Pseudomonas syringae group genomosp. 7 TaxID=251699 RepID=UPI00376F86A2
PPLFVCVRPFVSVFFCFLVVMWLLFLVCVCLLWGLCWVWLVVSCLWLVGGWWWGCVGGGPGGAGVGGGWRGGPYRRGRGGGGAGFGVLLPPNHLFYPVGLLFLYFPSPH